MCKFNWVCGTPISITLILRDFKGNSVKNDTIPALLSAGEEVLPRSVTMAPDAPQKAYDFVKHLQEQKENGKGGKGYAAVAASKGNLKDRVERLEKMFQGGAA